MTIGTVVAWIGDQSVWWLLVLAPLIWMFRGLRGRLHGALLRRDLKGRIKQLGLDRASHMRMGFDFKDARIGHADRAAWCEWQRVHLRELLDTAEFWRGLGVPDEEAEAYNRRFQALTDAYYLAKDEAFIKTKGAAFAEDLGLAEADPALAEEVLAAPAEDARDSDELP